LPAELGAGESLTGVWSLTTENPAIVSNTIPVPVSFSVPLSEPLEAANVHYIPSGDPIPTECENATHAGAASVTNPEAASGEFCMYAHAFSGVFSFSSDASAEEEGIGVVGGLAWIEMAGPGVGGGSWAVTG
jgi:hypothetical protein